MTDRKSPLGATELRLYVVVLLAVIYVVAWRVIRPAASNVTAQPALPAAPTAPRTAGVPAPRVQRAPARAHLVRSPVSRPRRVRTRSS